MGSIRPRTIIEYLGLVWRRKLLVILFATVVMVAALNAMAPVRNIYEANALVAISAQSSDDRSAVDVLLATANQSLVSRANLEPIISRYSLYGKSSDLDASIVLLRKDLKVDVKVRDYYPQFPISFVITYRHNDPLLAMQVTNDLVSFFNETNEAIEKRNASQIKELSSEIAQIEERLRQINQQRNSNELSSSSLSAIKSQRASLISMIGTLSDKEARDNQRVTQQRKLINEQEGLVKVLPPSPESALGSSAYGVLLGEKARLEAQLKDQLSQYTDKNSKVVSTQTQIGEVNRQLAQLEEKAGRIGMEAGASQEMRDLKALKRDLANYEFELELTRRDLKRKQDALALLPNIEVSPAEIAAIGAERESPTVTGDSKVSESGDEHTLLFNRYGTLTEKRDSLLRFGAAKGDSNSGLFQVVDKAVLPKSPVAPNRAKLMLIALAIASVAGLMAAFIAEAPKWMMIQDERDIEYLLGAPVVGLIPETLTPPESRRNRKLLLVRTLGVLLFAATLVPVLTVFLKKIQVFQLFAK